MRFVALVTLFLSMSACKPRYVNSYGLRADGEGGRDYGSKTTYAPGQDIGSYEAPPAGFQLSFVQILSRHSSRGLSSPGDDVIMLDFLQQAEKKKALTPLGLELLADIKKMIDINTNLGRGLPDIQKPGYGNLSALGMREHRGLGERLFKRQKAYFTALQQSGKTIEFLTSGENRAQDSAGLFTNSLVAGSPGLKALLKPATPLVSGSTEPGVDRFMLYFHKLDAVADIPLPGNAVYAKVLADSLAYQAFKDGVGPDSISAKIKKLKETPESLAAAKKVIEGLVTKDFVAAIEAGTLSFSNAPPGSGGGTVDAAKPRSDIPTKDVSSPAKTDMAEMVKTVKDLYSLVERFYGVYSICPGLKEELGGKNFEKYFPAQEAALFTSLGDLDDFYIKGPSTVESRGATSNMARGLLASFFDETDAVLAGTQKRGALLRFAHAETVIPFATTLGIKKVGAPIPAAQNYSYETSIWRGEKVAPLAVNAQWEVYQQASGGSAIVKLLYNEKEADFKAACAGAKIVNTRSFYDYAKLKACYYPQ